MLIYIETLDNSVYTFLAVCICMYFLYRLSNIKSTSNTKIYMRDVDKAIQKFEKADILFISNENDNIESEYVIPINKSQSFIKKLKENSKTDKPIYLIIHSTGGSVVESDIIINAIMRHNNPIYTFVPAYAESAATLIALTGQQIFMDSYSYMTPTDTQLHVQFDNNDKVFGSKVLMDYLNIILRKNVKIQDPIFVLDALDAKMYHKDNIETLKKIMFRKNISRTNINKIIDILGSGNLPHHYPIGPDDLQKLGIPIENYPEDVAKISKLYLENL